MVQLTSFGRSWEEAEQLDNFTLLGIALPSSRPSEYDGTRYKRERRWGFLSAFAHFDLRSACVCNLEHSAAGEYSLISKSLLHYPVEILFSSPFNTIHLCLTCVETVILPPVCA